MASRRSRSRNCTEVQPNPFVEAQLKMLDAFPRQSLPRYLFRCYSFETPQRRSSPIRFDSAVRHELKLQQKGVSLPPLLTANIFEVTLDAQKHLRFRKDHDFKSPFISFTSSLLVALSRARTAEFEGAQDVMIAVFDTRKITSLHPRPDS
jgi:hypothetical protein